MPRAATNLGHLNYGDYCRWPDEERWELIDGTAFAVSPAPTRLHQALAVEVTRQIANQLLEHPCDVYAAPFDVRLPKSSEADDLVDTVVQPDISVICDPDKLDDKGGRGAPDWIIEILSARTAAHDQIRKRALYERHAVREYWLVHPIDRVLTIYRLDPDGVYGRPDSVELEGATKASAVPGLEIRWPTNAPTED
ncbi:Uma2 family endonuclease [Thiorhodococcus minor]|uniref:Uma2 family endonuclease n=1 Tax=Thiorhodococcus minor TaxID=57489 RepID=A0A6M0K6R5_9GAMM|nr:Uma2 family endonuclease [Thiorhodococcus minor]NEV65021.1 Uma2 family endonuclease [Thiorhodococcus minor]